MLGDAEIVRYMPARPRPGAVPGASPRESPAVLAVVRGAAAQAAIEAAAMPSGARLIVARSGAGALRKLGRLDPAVIVVDTASSGFSGPEVARQLRGHERVRQVPIVLLVDADDPFPDKPRDVGVERMVRSTDPDALRARLRMHLLLHAEREALDQEARARMDAEDRLRDAERRCLALSARLASIRDEERARIAREIHDELGQVLTGLRMDVGWLARKFGPSNRHLSEKTAAMTRLIDSTVDLVRRIATGLRPEILERFGLAAAMRQQADEFQARTGIRCRCTLAEGSIDPGSEICGAVYRTFQELLTNVARHARAGHVDIRLRITAQCVVLEVEDDGIGIRPDRLDAQDSLGLVGLRERAQLFGGTFTMDGVRGTRGTLTIPLNYSPPGPASAGHYPHAPP